MDFNTIEKFNDGIIVKSVKNFELSHIFDCGQCFRWNKQLNGNYIGTAYGKVIEIEKSNDNIFLYNTNEEDFAAIWVNYFDLYRDYGTIKKELKSDPLLNKAIEFGSGIRLLQQEPFEIIISFIISANNRIPMIKKAINNISKNWGNAIIYKDTTYYTFPKIENLINVSIEELQSCGVGFRAKYIKDTIEKIYTNKDEKSLNIDWIKAQEDEICHNELQKFTGIGPKVADCIMLFSMEKYSAFPVDVWVKRAMNYFYLAPDVSLKKIREFGRNKFGAFSGFAQQYLFYYAREQKIVEN